MKKVGLLEYVPQHLSKRFLETAVTPDPNPIACAIAIEWMRQAIEEGDPPGPHPPNTLDWASPDKVENQSPTLSRLVWLPPALMGIRLLFVGYSSCSPNVRPFVRLDYKRPERQQRI